MLRELREVLYANLCRKKLKTLHMHAEQNTRASAVPRHNRRVRAELPRETQAAGRRQRRPILPCLQTSRGSSIFTSYTKRYGNQTLQILVHIDQRARAHAPATVCQTGLSTRLNSCKTVTGRVPLTNGCITVATASARRHDISASSASDCAFTRNASCGTRLQCTTANTPHATAPFGSSLQEGRSPSDPTLAPSEFPPATRSDSRDP
jgi:hypothetical protein